MTREEERLEQSKFYNDKGVKDPHVHFLRGSEWADSTMIDKACEWLREELDKEEERHYIHVHGFDKERREIFLEDFRKAMKGE